MKQNSGIFCAGVDHHATALAEREALVSLAGERLVPHLIEHNGAEEAVFLSTCNRVEIYGVSRWRGLEITEALVRAMPAKLGQVWQATRGVYLHEGDHRGSGSGDAGKAGAGVAGDAGGVPA